MNYKAIFLKALPHILAVLVMTAASVAYFYPQLEGKVMQQGDIVSASQSGGEIKEYSSKTGKYYQWNNGQFSGMPRMMWVKMKYNKVLKIYNVFKLGFKDPIGMYLSLMIFAYILFYYLSSNHILSIALAIATSLNTSNVILWSAGHYSKISTLVFTPLIILSALLIFEKKLFRIGGILLVFALSASLTMQHVQMTYYIFLFFLVFAAVYFYRGWKNRDISNFGKSSFVAILACVLALGISSTRMLCVYDYSKSSIRGESILTDNGSKDIKKEGLDWEYSTQWSNDSKDLVASYLIPGFVGGGSGESVSRKSESYKKYRIDRAPLYWGNLPFTEGPMYLGVSIVFIFILGLFIIKGSMKWWMGLGVLLLTFLSMGKNLEVINKLVYAYFPMYDKFRVPQSILNTILFYLPVLGILSISSIIGKRDLKVQKNQKKRINSIRQTNNSLFYSAAIVLVPIIFYLLFGSSVLSFESANDLRYIEQGFDVNIIKLDRIALLKSDALRSLFIIILMVASIWGYLNRGFNKYIFSSVLALIIVFDMLGVSKRYVNSSDFVRKSSVDKTINNLRPVDQKIMQLETYRHNYRVQDLTINTYNSSATTYFHNTIGGYDPAKLRRYQDLIERQINRGNMQVYNMLNTKYFIINKDEGPNISINEGALGNAWFVQNINFVNNANEEMNSLNNIDTKFTATVLASDFNILQDYYNFSYDQEARISLVEYEPNRLVYKTSAKTDQFAVFSELWYNGNRDWVSYIDGKRVDHVRANYALRAMKIPSGEHEVIFEFKPVMYSIGEKISLSSMIVYIIIILSFLVVGIKNQKNYYSK